MEMPTTVSEWFDLLAKSPALFARVKIESEAAIFHGVRLKSPALEIYAKEYLREIWRRAVKETDPVWRQYYDAQLAALLQSTPNGMEVIKKLERGDPI